MLEFDHRTVHEKRPRGREMADLEEKLPLITLTLTIIITLTITLVI